MLFAEKKAFLQHLASRLQNNRGNTITDELVNGICVTLEATVPSDLPTIDDVAALGPPPVPNPPPMPEDP